jgi:F0F1-type ATP synthase membrane subunit a
MNRANLDYDRVMWRARIFGNIRAGAVLLFLAAVCLAIAVAAAPSAAGTISGVTVFVICLAAGIYLLLQANRIRKMEP